VGLRRVQPASPARRGAAGPAAATSGRRTPITMNHQERPESGSLLEDSERPSPAKPWQRLRARLADRGDS
jgi:hypothetical protein